MHSKKSPHAMLALAALHASSSDDGRTFLLAAIGIRSDGAIVTSHNALACGPTPKTHAEARLARKLDVGSIVFVARVLRRDGSTAMAKPCELCEARLRRVGVVRVWYTVDGGGFNSIRL